MKKLITILFILFSGVLSAQTLVTAPLVRNNPADIGYPVTYDTLQRGGWMTVQDTISRNNLPQSVRRLGMVVHVVFGNTKYTLINGIANANWEVFNVASGAGDTTRIRWPLTSVPRTISGAARDSMIIKGHVDSTWYNPTRTEQYTTHAYTGITDTLIIFGTGGGITGVQSVNGLVDNTDPLNPIVLPTNLQVSTDAGKITTNDITVDGNIRIWRGLNDVNKSILIGDSAGRSSTGSTAKSIGIGVNALGSTTSGDDNISIGYQSLINNTSGGFNVAIGTRALGANTTTGSSIAIGYEAMSMNTQASNMGIGIFAMRRNTTGGGNIGIGNRALEGSYVGITGFFNTAVGSNSQDSLSTGAENTAVGYFSLLNNKTGSQNSAFGVSSMRNKISGDFNSAYGRYSLWTNSIGSRNTALGAFAGYLNAGDDNVFVGHQAGYNEVGSNKLYIDNTTTATPLIWGDFTTNALKFNGSVAIVDGTEGLGKVFTSDASGNGTWQTAGGGGSVTAGNGLRNVNSTTLALANNLFTNGVLTDNFNLNAGNSYNFRIIAGDGFSSDADMGFSSTQSYSSFTGTGYQSLSTTEPTRIGSGVGDNVVGHSIAGYNITKDSIVIGRLKGVNYQGIRIDTSLRIRFLGYGAGTNTGTATRNLAVTAAGNVIEVALGGGGASSQWRDTTTGIYYPIARVGIGSNIAPAYKLDVVGDINVSQDSFYYYGGQRALFQKGTGSWFLASAGNLTATGTSNVGIGGGALFTIGTGIENTAVGSNALRRNVIGDRNTAVGIAAGSNVLGYGNTAIGANALTGNTININVSSNSGFGKDALGRMISGATKNTALGDSALHEVTNGDENIAVGYASGVGITTGSQNTIVGSNINIGNVSNNVLLADGSGAIRLWFDNTGRARMPLYGSGTFTGTATQDLKVDASGNIIEVTPAVLLKANGTLHINVVLQEFPNNAQALAAGLEIGDFYRHGDDLRVVH